jgi:hypothetical protein
LWSWSPLVVVNCSAKAGLVEVVIGISLWGVE